MTDEVLESDIEAALKVLKAGGGEAEIAAALVRRKVAPARAAQLASDLAQGRYMAATAVPSPVPPTPPGARGPEPLSKDAQPASGDRKGAARGPHSPRHRRRHKGYWLAILSLGCLVWAGILAFSYLNRRTTDSREQPGPRETPASSTGRSVGPAEARPPLTQPAALILQLQPDGLRLNNSLITPANAPGALAAILGAPSRTNRVQPSNQTVYDFDGYGLALHSQPDGNGASVVLDYQGLGSAGSPHRPFWGVLQVEGQDIRANTDSRTLAAIKALGLTGAGSNTNILRGQYGNLGLTFMYLDSSRRLGLAEIDLR